MANDRRMVAKAMLEELERFLCLRGFCNCQLEIFFVGRDSGRNGGRSKVMLWTCFDGQEPCRLGLGKVKKSGKKSRLVFILDHWVRMEQLLFHLAQMVIGAKRLRSRPEVFQGIESLELALLRLFEYGAGQRQFITHILREVEAGLH